MQESTIEWRQNWPLVITSTVGMAVGLTHLYSLSVFMEPIASETGWSRARIASSLTIISVFSVTLSVFVGIAIDRLGPRRVGLYGILPYFAAIAMVGLVGSAYWQWLVIWVVIGLCAQLLKPTIWTAAVASRFSTGRGLALAVVLSGSGIASVANPIVANYFIDIWGWRLAYPALAACWAVISLPLCFLFLYGAKDLARTGRAKGNATLKARPVAGMTLVQSLRAWRFWCIAGATTLMTMITLGLSVHSVAIMTGAGLSRGTASSLAGLAGICAVVARLTIGHLLDRFYAPVVTASVFCSAVVAQLMLLFYDGSVTMSIFIVCLNGIALGGEADAAAYLVTRYFGVKHYGALFGVIVAMFGAATGLGPLIGGLIYDSAGSYFWFYTMSACLGLVTLPMLLVLGKYPVWEEDRGTPG